MELALLGVYHAIRSSSRIDKVNKTVKHLLTLDRDGDKQLSNGELEAALKSLKGRSDKTALKERSLLVYLIAAHKRWARDPKGTKERLKKACPFGGSWNKDPNVAKLEMMVYSFFFKSEARASDNQDNQNDQGDQDDQGDETEEGDTQDAIDECTAVAEDVLGGFDFDFSDLF